jgi:SNF2 family DNA or RNA helicase
MSTSLVDFPVKKIFSTWCSQKNLNINNHQLEGIECVIKRERQPELGSAGGFVCDEMGLGKTILMIGAMVINPKARNLVVLPKSLMDQWCNAITRFTALDHDDVLVYHGANGRVVKTEDIRNYRVVITTYGMIATRKTKGNKPLYSCPLWTQPWDRIIYDESHHLRNSKTGQFKGACLLKAPIKWMVTGTPINNKKRDFYTQSLIQGSGSHFTPRMKEIRKIIDSIVLRRTKKKVGIQMPDLNEEVIEVKWQSPEEEVFVRNIHNLIKFAPVTANNVDAIIQNLGSMFQSIFPIFMLMRQACVKPSLAYNSLMKRGLRSELETINQLTESPTSSKIDAVVNKVIENRSTKKSKLIFCLFREEMEHIRINLKKEGFNSAIINGSTTKKQRRFALQAGLKNDEWETIAPILPEDVRGVINSYLASNILIAQIQTSCEGLNLQHFAEVYFTTPHWNPAIESQAIARCHRIGQEKDVDVYRFVTKFNDDRDEASMSLDQYCMEVQRVKKDIAIEYGL